MTDELTADQRKLLADIPPMIGRNMEKDWAAVPSERAWGMLQAMPAGLLELNEESCPILAVGKQHVLGRGWVRLTDAGRAALPSI